MAQVLIRNIRKSYGDVVALQDISLDIPTGSFYTLLGPSGCGKTTLLRTIAGFHRQDEGSIQVGQQILDTVPVHQRDIGMVFQDYAIFPHLSVEKNIAFGLRQRRVASAETRTRVAEILKVVQLEHLAQRMPHELSGGQQQRVGLARALVTRPKVLLMDEPLSNLDAQLRVDLRKELRFIQQELGITTIYVTHDQEEALEMSDHVCVMHKGIIQQAASPWQIYQQPANQFVASFVGSNNFLPVTASDGQVQICQTIIHPAPQSVVMAGTDKAGIVAAIRPEHIQLSIDPHCATAEGYINIAATLNHQAFAGRELRVSALAADQTPIQLITQPLLEYLELPAHSPVRLLVKISDIGFYRNDDGGERL